MRLKHSSSVAPSSMPLISRRMARQSYSFASTLSSRDSIVFVYS
jgi:hypothetical protein